MEREPANRGGMTREEREARSRLTKLVREVRFLRGGLYLKKHRCGQPTCRCAHGGDPHVQFKLESRQDGKRVFQHVPNDLLDTVREWSANYEEIRSLIETISRIHWEKVRKREV